MFNQYLDSCRAETLDLMYNESTAAVTRMFIRDTPYYTNYGGNVGELSAVLFQPVLDPRDKEQKIIG